MTFKKFALITALLIGTITGAAAGPYSQDFRSIALWTSVKTVAAAPEPSLELPEGGRQKPAAFFISDLAFVTRLVMPNKRAYRQRSDTPNKI